MFDDSKKNEDQTQNDQNQGESSGGDQGSAGGQATRDYQNQDLNKNEIIDMNDDTSDMGE